MTRFKPRPALKPCEFCGQEYMKESANQQSHTQSEWCRKETARARDKARRPPKSRRKSEHKARILLVKDPLRLAHSHVRRRFPHLHRHYLDDTSQTIALAILELGVNPLSSAKLDILLMFRSVNHSMVRLYRDLGFHWHGNDLKQDSISLDNLVNYSKQNWHTLWRTS